MKISFRAQARFSATILLAMASLGSTGCGSDDETKTDDGALRAKVIENYTVNVAANYADTLKTAKALNTAVKAFVESPSEDTLEDARGAWLKSRDPYGLSEAYRFYQGPIDNDDADDDIPDGPEGLLNSWPLDESYIDYTLGDKDEVLDTGIINDPKTFPEITAKVLSDANTAAGEDSISTGYHAIEFLLWGQDHSVSGPGERPYTDYVPGAEGSKNQERRAEYLLAVTQLLVDNIAEVNDAWLDGEANYRADFLKMSRDVALGKILLGMGSLAGGELSHERIQVAFDDKDQEQEHSCFSDNTLADLINNATSVQDVLLGTYGKLQGPGIADLVEAKDPALAQKLREQIQDAIDNLKATPGPFDVAIMGSDSTPARKHLAAAIQSLKDFRDTVTDAGKALGLELDFE